MKRHQSVRVLGPIDVVTRVGVVSIGGSRPRALLGALAMAAGRAVPADHLREVLWGDHPPPSADNTLQSYISELRHVLGADAIQRIDHAYELDLGTTDIDVLQFERLLREAAAARDEPSECWGLCHEALGLWRGCPFGDLADDEPFLLEAHRLDELRLTAMELSLEADLALDRHELIVGELESAVDEYPYRERLWYLLIAALARSDRRVEALRTCARLRDVLGDVGIEVGDEFVALEHGILEGDMRSAP